MWGAWIHRTLSIRVRSEPSSYVLRKRHRPKLGADFAMCMRNKNNRQHEHVPNTLGMGNSPRRSSPPHRHTKVERHINKLKTSSGRQPKAMAPQATSESVRFERPIVGTQGSRTRLKHAPQETDHATDCSDSSTIGRRLSTTRFVATNIGALTEVRGIALSRRAERTPTLATPRRQKNSPYNPREGNCQAT